MSDLMKKIQRLGQEMDAMPDPLYTAKAFKEYAKDAIDRHATTADQDFVGFGYAPGNYMRNCRDCGQQSEGSKRSFRCKPCAMKAKAAEPVTTAETPTMRCKTHGLAKVPLEIGHGRPPLMICTACAESFDQWIADIEMRSALNETKD